MRVCRAERLGHRRHPLLRLVLAVVMALGLTSSLAAVRLTRQKAQMKVQVMVGGVARPVRLDQPATVADALSAAGVVPRDGRLLSLVTKKVLNPSARPAVLLVDGRAVPTASLVRGGAIVTLQESADSTEESTENAEFLPAPSLPATTKGLWHPGQPGKALGRKGVVSGEVLTERQIQAVVPPAPVTEKLVTLTFDDGPWPVSTPDILRILREKNVKAVFCVITRQLVGEGLAFAKGAMSEGHQMCNHTVNHDVGLPTRGQQIIDQEIRGGNHQLVDRLGLKPDIYRPPGGSTGPSIEATARDEGQQVLLWTVDTSDFRKPPPEVIVATVMANIRPGGVVLMHDGGGDRSATVAALPALIDQLRAAGYELVLPSVVAPVPAAPILTAPSPA